MYRPNFRISNNLLKYIGRIEACREIIANAPMVPSWESHFRRDAMVRSVHYGTHLEGNELSKEQTEKIVGLEDVKSVQAASEDTDILAKDDDIQEVLNYRSVLEWIDAHETSGEERSLYTEDTLKRLHKLTITKLMPDEETGEYRKKQVVVRSVESGDVVFRPPVSFEVPDLIKEFFEWLGGKEAREIHPVLLAGITHYELVRIHPFTEGNGRTARAMAVFVLYSEGYDIKKFFSLEEYFDKNIEDYYRAILSVQKSENNDLTYWLEYFSYGLAIELDRIKDQVLKLSQDMRLKSKMGGKQVALSERQIILLELMQNTGEMTTNDAAEALPMVSSDTILRDLKDLIAKGIIRKHGVTKGVSYRLNE